MDSVFLIGIYFSLLLVSFCLMYQVGNIVKFLLVNKVC